MNNFRKFHKPHLKVENNKNQAFRKFSLNELVYDVFKWYWRKRKVLNILHEFQNACRSVWPSVETIAKRCGIKERMVQYYLDELEREGMLKREIRTYNTTIYHLHPTFLSYWVRKALKEWLPALAFVPFMIFAMAQAKNKQEKHQRLEAQVQRTIHEYEKYCTLLKNKTSFYKTLFPLSSYQARDLQRGGVDKKGKTMKIPEYLENSPIPLTLYGKIRLSAFNRDAIQHAFGGFLASRGIKNPFGFIYSAALKHQTKSQNLEPDWALYFRLMEQHPDVKPTDEVIEARGNASSPQEGRRFIKEGYGNQEGKIHCYLCDILNRESNPKVYIVRLWEKNHQREGSDGTATENTSHTATDKGSFPFQDILKHEGSAFNQGEAIPPAPLRQDYGGQEVYSQNTNENGSNLNEEEEYAPTIFEWL